MADRKKYVSKPTFVEAILLSQGDTYKVFAASGDTSFVPAEKFEAAFELCADPAEPEKEEPVAAPVEVGGAPLQEGMTFDPELSDTRGEAAFSGGESQVADNGLAEGEQ